MSTSAPVAQPDNAHPDQGHGFDYDLVVLGGGSGGLACVKQAAALGQKCAVLDFVKPTPQGTFWDIGGTCVNVGCIPKKLFHITALLRDRANDMPFHGWNGGDNLTHDWSTMVNNVQDYIKSLQWGSKSDLRSVKCEYLNEYGVFVDPHTVECTNRDGEKRKISARRFVIAVGGRPSYVGLDNERELCITSDDLFSLSRPPGKTLVVGASYVALECAGFLHGLGYDTTVMARSIFLRGFDQECANRVGNHMAHVGIKFLRPAVPTAFDKTEDGRIRVTYQKESATDSDVFDTVLIAVGRHALTKDLQLEKAGVVVGRSGKLPTICEQTNVPHIYALGDVIEGRPELTPSAIQAGQLLARRLYGGSSIQMDYDLIPTTVFTPIEYGCCGLSEEEAVSRYGEDNIEVYHRVFQPLEMKLNWQRYEEKCFMKLICLKPKREQVIGMHYVGTNAGEVIQGFSLGMKMGATKADFDNLIGIHPTAAENFTTLDVTKASGEDPDAGGC